MGVNLSIFWQAAKWLKFFIGFVPGGYSNKFLDTMMNQLGWVLKLKMCVHGWVYFLICVRKWVIFVKNGQYVCVFERKKAKFSKMSPAALEDFIQTIRFENMSKGLYGPKLCTV